MVVQGAPNKGKNYPIEVLTDHEVRSLIRAWLAGGCPRRSLWRWTAADLPRLDQLVRGRRCELTALMNEVQATQQELNGLDQKIKKCKDMIENQRRKMAALAR